MKLTIFCKREKRKRKNPPQYNHNHFDFVLSNNEITVSQNRIEQNVLPKKQKTFQALKVDD